LELLNRLQIPSPITLNIDPIPRIKLAVILHLIPPHLLERDGQFGEDGQVVRDQLHGLGELAGQGRVLIHCFAPAAVYFGWVGDEQDAQAEEFGFACESVVDYRFFVSDDLVGFDFLDHGVD